MVYSADKNVFCIKCGKLAHKIMIIQDRGYGSKFDCYLENTLIPVCPECAKYLPDDLFHEHMVKTEKGYGIYPNEHKIMSFIDSLPQEKQDIIYQ